MAAATALLAHQRPASGAPALMTKTRYRELEAELMQALPAAATAAALEALRRVLGFDPALSSTTEKRAAASRACRERKLAEGRARGLTSYQVLNGREAYERKKARDHR